MEISDKSIVHFAEELNNELSRQIGLEETMSGNRILNLKDSLDKCRVAYQTLKNFISGYTFDNDNEEISFFKIWKPQIHSLLIYYTKALTYEIQIPNGTKSIRQDFLQKELLKIRIFFEAHIEFVKYYKTGDTWLDAQYFLRRKASNDFYLHTIYIDFDPDFSTGYDYLAAKILAYEKLTFLIEKLSENVENSNNNRIFKSDIALTWTDSKTSLIELSYALHSAGSFNNGKADIKQIIEFFQLYLRLDLGNTSRTFQEILSRKKGHTNYIDRLKATLLQKIDRIDEG